MNKFSAIAIIIAAVVLEITIAPHLKLGGVFPNLPLVALAYISLSAQRREVLAASLAGGLFLDLFSSFPFGVFIVIFVLIGMLLNESKYYLFARANFLIVLLAVFIATILFYLLSFLLLKIFVFWKMSQIKIFFKESIFFAMPKELLANLIAAIIISAALKIINKSFVKKVYGLRPNFL
jgi:rod shape-determining protein MreD